MSKLEEGVNTIVLDCGTGMIKAGVGGDDAPRAVFPNTIGRPKFKEAMVGMGTRSLYVGDEAVSKRGVLQLKYPVEHGIVTNFDNWESIIGHMMRSELRYNPEEHAILFNLPVRNPRANTEKMAQILFETFQFKAIQGVLEPAMAMYSCGTTTGTIVQIGEGVTQIMPFHSSAILETGIIRKDFGGADMTQYLAKLVRENSGLDVAATTNSYLHEDLGMLKEKACQVAKDYDLEMSERAATSEHDYAHLIDYQGISIGISGAQRLRLGETMFKPALMGIESPGLHQLVAESISRCAIDLRPDLRSVYVMGGVSMAPGFAERLQHELSGLSPSTQKIRVIAPPERKYSTWIGGSIMASLPCQTWMTKQDYDERGPQAVHQYGVTDSTYDVSSRPYW